MDLSEYQQIVSFLSSNSYPDDLQDTSTKAAKNRRDNFKAKTKKFFVKGELYRFIPGHISGAKVILKDKVKDVLAEFHGSAFGGHSGVNKTREAIKSRYWWFGLTDDVKNYVNSCEACQKSDPLKPAKKPELQQIKVSTPFELVGVDLVGPLAETEQGNKYIFTATDYFTKWVEAFPIPSKSATDVAKCFEKLFSRHGAVNAILTDQGREFLNQVNDQLCRDWNIQHRVTAAYHPQTNGLDEKTNQTLKATLRKMVNEHQTDWDQYLDGALFSQRTKPHSSTKYSPFFLLYGREAVYPSQLPKDFCYDIASTQPSEQDIDSHVNQRLDSTTATTESVKENMEKAHQKQQKDYKHRMMKGRKYSSFKVGNTVLVLNTKKTAAKKGNLQPNYTGPYTIVNIQGKTATLKNSTDHVLKKQFSLDHLKPFQSPDSITTEQEESTTTLSDQQSSTHSECQPTSQLKVQQYLQEVSTTGQLQELITFVSSLHLNQPTTRFNLQRLLMECLQSFVAEVSKDSEEEMDIFASNILPHIRHLPMDLAAKTTMTMIISSVCVKASSMFQPVMVMAETLKLTPSHLKETVITSPLIQSERLSAGGETLEGEDLATLNEGQWLNDKIINSYLGVLRMEKNISSLQVFVLPSYTAVLWENGHLDQWMFRKVMFSMYKYIMMPINTNGNHWMLMVIDMTEKSVCILDSMHGQHDEKYLTLWKNFIERRNLAVEEKLGPWTSKVATSSIQTDGNSCGVFTLMNAECIVKEVPVQVMRQVHCKTFRKYIQSRLLTSGTTKAETYCDMPGCKLKSKTQRWVQCCVCGRWMHTRCCGIPVKSAIEDEFVCCICKAMYT